MLKELAMLCPGSIIKNASGESLPGSAPRSDVSGYIPPESVTRNISGECFTVKMKCACHTKWCDKWNCGVLIILIRMISTPQFHLSHHLVWHAHFIFTVLPGSVPRLNISGPGYVPPGSVIKTVSGKHLPGSAPRPDVSGYVPSGSVIRNVRVGPPGLLG